MSMMSLMNHRVNILRPNLANETDDAGLPVHDPVLVLSAVVGRVVKNSAREQDMWSAVGVVADYRFITLESSIEHNWFLEMDGRRWRVTNSGEKVYAQGTIASHYSYQLQEIRSR